MSPSVKRFYFVDETGQDPLSRVFIVAVSVMPRDYREIENACLGYEKASGKDHLKWHKSKVVNRLRFMRLIVEDERFAGTLVYASTVKAKAPNFDQLTIDGIAQVIEQTRDEESSASEIYVDGLSPTKLEQFGKAMRVKGIRHARFHKATDHASTLIRLADALAGLARDAIENKDSEAAKILQRGKRNGVVIESK